MQIEMSWDIREHPWVAKVFIVIGLTLAISGVVWGYTSKKFLDEADGTVIGKVIDVKRDEGATAPIIEYEVDGRLYTFESHLYTSPGYQVGERVDLRYRSDKPNDPMIMSFVRLWVGPGVLLLAGVLFAAVGGFFVRRRARPTRE